MPTMESFGLSQIIRVKLYSYDLRFLYINDYIISIRYVWWLCDYNLLFLNVIVLSDKRR